MSREGNPPQAPPTPLKRVLAKVFRSCSCKLALLAFKLARRHAELGWTNCLQKKNSFFLDGCVFLDGSLSLENASET